MLSNQTFRDVFKADNLHFDQRLKITSLTFLFTDLKGSTALYERVGDLAAFDLVRAHFRALLEIISSEKGAVVKTMGGLEKTRLNGRLIGGGGSWSPFVDVSRTVAFGDFFNLISRDNQHGVADINKHLVVLPGQNASGNGRFVLQLDCVGESEGKAGPGNPHDEREPF